MEQKTETVQTLTKANINEEKRVSITAHEALEYREYKRQRKRAEILSAISKSEGILTDGEEEKRVRERAMRLRQAAVCMTPKRLETLWEIFAQSAVAVDCLIGGNGETLAKVKACEARLAMKLRARELTLILSHYCVINCKYDELRKEIKRVRRAAPKAILKVRVDKVYSATILSRLARLCAEVGAAYFCVPYFDGCERLRLDLKGGCKLQVFGVNSLEILKKLHAAGVERIVTAKAEEMHAEWMKEVEKINFPELMAAEKKGTVQSVAASQVAEQNAAMKALRLLTQEPPKLLTDGKKRECEVCSVNGACGVRNVELR